MHHDSDQNEQLINRMQAGQPEALGEVFAQYRTRLKYMVRLRMDRRLYGRVAPSDVLQEAYLDASKRLEQYSQNPSMPAYLWLRFLTGQRLLAVHRQHLGAQMRDAAQEVAIYQGTPQATSECIAVQLIGGLTSPSQAAVREEIKLRLQDALNRMEPIDREILTLRHFEELTNNEVALVLEIQKSTASNRYIRALKRLKQILKDMPEFNDE